MASIILTTLLFAAACVREGEPSAGTTCGLSCQARSSISLSSKANIRNSISPLNFDAVPGRILVGAKDALYLLSNDLTLVQKLNISGPPCGGQVCPTNLVRLYSSPPDSPTTVVVCASVGLQCSLVNTSGGTLTMATDTVPSSSTLLTSDPNIPSVGIFFNLTTSRNTNFFAASGTSLTFHTFNPNDPTSLNNSLMFGFTATNNVFNLTTWFSPLLVIVDVYKADYPMRGPLPQGFSGTPTPDEHKYLFVFVREQDPATLAVTNKLVRLCQNDPGSVSGPNGLPFPTTLLKANITCQRSSGPLRPNLLQGVVFSRPGRYFAGGEWVELMYGTFTDYTGYSPQTSICVYRANDSDALVPNGNNNRGVFDIFRSLVFDPLSGKNIANAYVECNTNGRTDSAAQRINLVQSILQYTPDPLAVLSDVVVTKMAVDQTCVLNGSSCTIQDVLFLGTSTGSVLKMTMSSINGSFTPVISDNYLTDTSTVRQMQMKVSLQDGVKYLYVNTDNGIYRLPLERCGQYLDCSGCVGSRDPYCVWNNVTSHCVKYTSDLNITMLYQDITTGTRLDCPAPGPTTPTDNMATSPTTSNLSQGGVMQRLTPISNGQVTTVGVAVGVPLGVLVIAMLCINITLVICILKRSSKNSFDINGLAESPNVCNSVTPPDNKGAPHESSEDQIETSMNPVYDMQGQIQQRGPSQPPLCDQDESVYF